MSIKATPSARTIEKLYLNLEKYPDSDISVDVQTATRVNGYISVEVKCNHCDYTTQHNLQSLVERRYVCTGCSVKRYRELCNTVNCEYISHKSVRGLGAHVLSNCKTCGTEIKSGLSDLIAGKKPTCEGCFINRCRQSASNLGCDYLGRCVKSRQVHLRCRTLAHEFNMAYTVMMKGQGGCNECRLNIYKDALSKRECKLVKLKSCKGSRTLAVYENSQGETLEASISNILRGEFAINSENPWRNHHSTYLIRTIFGDNAYFKIGTSATPEQRLKKLNLLGESKVYTLDSFSDRFGANKLESELHKEFKNFKLERTIADEFTTAIKKVKRKGETEKVRIKDGSTEWFTHEVYDILKTRYNLTEGSANGS